MLYFFFRLVAFSWKGVHISHQKVFHLGFNIKCVENKTIMYIELLPLAFCAR